QWLRHGIVVEANLYAKRGLQNNDVLLAWSHGQKHGVFRSPMDFMRVGMLEEGKLTIHGVRNRKKRTWELTFPESSSGVSTRPNFSEPFLSHYLAGAELSKNGKAAEAVQQWQSLMSDLGSEPPWLGGWLMLRSARAWSYAQQWPQADEAYAAGVRAISTF